MIDGYGRNIDYLRISITDRCNLRCVYCMPKTDMKWMDHNEILRYEEIHMICETMARNGLKHIKITGGEPLVRKDCSSLIRNLKEIPGIDTVTLTTNGILLEEYIDSLVEAGVDGINISLDTLDELEYRKITRGGDLSKVIGGLKKTISYPEITVKINCVLTGMEWKSQAKSIGELALRYPVHVRFIEHMPVNVGEETGVVTQDEIRLFLEECYGISVKTKKPLGFGPCEYYSFERFQGKIGFISAMSHKFCKNCNRVRLTANGKLRLCLQSKEVIDIKEIIRGNHKETLEEVILNGLLGKPKEHHFDQKDIETVSMAQIGG